MVRLKVGYRHGRNPAAPLAALPLRLVLQFYNLGIKGVARSAIDADRELLKKAVEQWSDDSIRLRTRELAAVITQIWPVPPNHRSSVASVQPRVRKLIDLSDLIHGGALQPGMSLFPRRKKYRHKVAMLLQDGQVLAAGGDYYDGVNGGFLSECELYDAGSGTWSVTTSMSTARAGAKTVLLRNGQVLVMGGLTDFSYIPTASAELYTP